MRNAFLLLLALAVAAAAASCGGGGAPADDDASAVVETLDEIVTTPAPTGSIRALLDEKAGEDVALVLGTSDFAVGENRVTFLVIEESGQLVDASRARVYVAPGDLDTKPMPALETTAENLPIGAAEAAGDDGFDAPSVWVTHVELDAPGLYSLLVEPEGAQIQAVGQIEVRSDTAVPGVGEKAIPSDTPTLEDGFPEEITTATPPDLELLRYSVKQSVEDGVPFVVTFATPKYCESRVCGPVVDIVDEVRTRLDDSGVRFIHVEIYENNDPNRGFNRWVREWNLPTEPYTFLVDGEGTIKSKFEGLLTVGELEEAVRAELL